MGNLCADEPTNSPHNHGTLAPYSKEVLLTRFLAEINSMRHDPAGYAKLVESGYISKINAFTHINTGVSYIEGPNAFIELRDLLLITSPLPPLTVENGLLASSFEHASFLSNTKIIDSVGRGGTTLSDRLSKYGKLHSDSVGESSILTPSSDPHKILIELLADDGIITRKNRLALLDPRFRQIGFSIVKESQGEYVAVVDLAVNFETDKSKATNDVVMRAEMELNR